MRVPPAPKSTVLLNPLQSVITKVDPLPPNNSYVLHTPGVSDGVTLIVGVIVGVTVFVGVIVGVIVGVAVFVGVGVGV